MCYHDQADFDYHDLVAYYKSPQFSKEVEEWTNVYHITGFSHRKQPVYKSDNQVDMLYWGLIPFFSKTIEDARKIRAMCLNAMSETAFDKPSFKHYIKSKRCLIPVTGFFEWRHIGKEKYPYFIHLKDQKIFSFGGIWNEWTNKETGELYPTFSILTTRANPLMEKIHNSKKRQPVIIPDEYHADWLSDKLTKEDVLAFCEPINQDLMAAHTISKKITSRTESSNVPDITQEVNYPNVTLGL